MLPFTTLPFFISALCICILLFLFKKKLSNFLKYTDIIFSITIIYTLLYIPDVKYLIGFLLYSYAVYRVSNYTRYGIIGIIFTILPMFLVKIDMGDNLYKIIGLSYVTFRNVQMIVDARNYGLLTFKEFTTFLIFPFTLLAGPIDRSYRFKDDLDNGYKNLTSKNLQSGWEILLYGVFFKFIIAELIRRFGLLALDASSTKITIMAANAYTYAFFLYFDFAGYSMMAVGLSTMFGINVPINFDKPWLAKNPQEFWRRFHITLGAWLTDYVFKPIYKSLNKYKKLRKHKLLIQNISLFLTFFVMGLWNGLELHYILSGCLFGVYSALHNTYMFFIKKNGNSTRVETPFIIFIHRFLMFNFAVLALYFFSGRLPL